MNKLLVCQHVAYEILGTLNPLLKQHGFRIHYVNFDRTPDAQPSLEGYDGLVILGGPMNVDEGEQYPNLPYEIELIRQAIKQELPVLGICLGAQLIAKALGANVSPNQEKEIGWYDVSRTEAGKQDPLLAHFKNVENIFQWHGDTFDIPDGAIHLATAPGCSNQAFRYGDKTYAFQFHLEVDQAMIERWLDVPLHQQELASLRGKISPEKIREQTATYIDQLIKLSENTFGEFIKLFAQQKKYRSLPSR